MIRRVCVVLVIATAAFGSTSRSDRRVYHVRCFDGRQTLYAAEVEGSLDTDFKVTLRDARHEIEAAFINEPLPSGGIESRIHLRSRRAWGVSPNGLPLWEEDDQRQHVEVDPDQQIDLLPFGGRGEAGLLKIEITPATVPSGANAQPLQIHISKSAPQGAIEVSAFRTPHWYTADVAILRNGVTAARTNGRLFVDEGGTMTIGGVDVHVTPSTVPFGSPEDLVSMHIDAPFAPGWNAVALAGKPMAFSINDNEQLVVTLRPEGGSL